jgi:predicted transcriptional regulator
MTHPVNSSQSAALGVNPEFARVFSNPVRSRILTEIGLRPTSPSQLARLVGEDLGYVSRCLRQLEKWGFAELVAERPGLRRGAAVEHLFRGSRRGFRGAAALRSVAPPSRRPGTQSVVDAFFAHVSRAMSAGTFDREPDRHSTWDSTILDRRGRDKVRERLDQLLASLGDLERESMHRLRGSGCRPIPATVAVACFDSPLSLEATRCLPPRCYHSAAAPGGGPFKVPPELPHALANRWRSRIAQELTVEPMSPSRFVERCGGDPSYVARCFREMASWGILEVAEERSGGQKGGGVERIYRRVERYHIRTPVFERLPYILRQEISHSHMSQYRKVIDEAVEKGSLDGAAGHLFSWRIVTLDRPGWKLLGEELNEIMYGIPEQETCPVNEHPKPQEELRPVIVGLTCF